MMTTTVIRSLLFSLIMTGAWHTNFEEAQQLARDQHKHILLNFSGSDWCGPCIVLRKEVFDDPVFTAMADSSLVLLNADFPRMKKDQLSKPQQQANERLADRYDPKGIFPLTLLLTAEGKILQQWEGNPGLTPAGFAGRIRTMIENEK